MELHPETARFLRNEIAVDRERCFFQCECERKKRGFAQVHVLGDLFLAVEEFAQGEHAAHRVWINAEGNDENGLPWRRIGRYEPSEHGVHWEHR